MKSNDEYEGTLGVDDVGDPRILVEFSISDTLEATNFKSGASP